MGGTQRHKRSAKFTENKRTTTSSLKNLGRDFFLCEAPRHTDFEADARLEGALLWPDGNQKTAFKQEIELRLFDADSLDVSQHQLLKWSEIEDKDSLSSTTSDEQTGYFWFPDSEGSDTPLNLLGNETRKEFWIAAKNCVILTPWTNDKVINIRGGGVLRIGVRLEQKEGTKGKKIVGHVWNYQRYPGPQVKDWPEKMHRVEIEIPDEETDDKKPVKRWVKAFYVIPVAMYGSDGKWL